MSDPLSNPIPAAGEAPALQSASTTAPAPSAAAVPSTGSRAAKAFGVVVDAGERWAIESGLLDQVAFVVSKTALVRSLVLAGASSLLGAGVVKGDTADILLGAAVTVLIGSLNSAIAHIRNKYAAQVQAAVGAQPDKFVGPETVGQVQTAMGALNQLAIAASIAKNLP